MKHLITVLMENGQTRYCDDGCSRGDDVQIGTQHERKLSSETINSKMFYIHH